MSNPHTSEMYMSKKHISTKQTSISVFDSRPWCVQVSHDFCPLVISLMVFICIISFILIVYFCARGTFGCDKLRSLLQSIQLKYFKRRSSSRSSRLSYERSLLGMNISPADRTFNFRANNYLTNQNRQIWYTDISKNQQPPPTYDESQSFTIRNLIKPMPINPSVNPKPNDIDVNLESFVFSNIRCLTLTSNETRASLNRLGNLSRQLLEQDVVYMGESSRNDECPPAYESVIKDSNNETRGNNLSERTYFISNECIV